MINVAIKFLAVALTGLLVGSVGTYTYVQNTIPTISEGTISITGTLQYMTAPPVGGMVPTTKFVVITTIGAHNYYLRNINANRLYFWTELEEFQEFDVVDAVGFPEYWSSDFGNGTWEVLSVVNIELAVK